MSLYDDLIAVVRDHVEVPDGVEGSLCAELEDAFVHHWFAPEKVGDLRIMLAKLAKMRIEERPEVVMRAIACEVCGSWIGLSGDCTRCGWRRPS